MHSDEQSKKNFLDDIKTFFDGIKHLGICATLALGLQYLQQPMIGANFNSGFIVFVNWVGLVMTIFLTIIALIWILQSFKTEPTSERFHIFSSIILGLLTVFIMFTVIFYSFNTVPLGFS